MLISLINILLTCGLIANAIPVREGRSRQDGREIVDVLDLIRESIGLAERPSDLDARAPEVVNHGEPGRPRVIPTYNGKLSTWSKKPKQKRTPRSIRRSMAVPRRLYKGRLQEPLPPTKPPREEPEKRSSTLSIVLVTISCTLFGAYLAFIVGKMIYDALSRPGRGYITIGNDADSSRKLKIPTLSKIREDAVEAVTKGKEKIKEAVKPAAAATSSRK